MKGRGASTESKSQMNETKNEKMFEEKQLRGIFINDEDDHF